MVTRKRMYCTRGIGRAFIAHPEAKDARSKGSPNPVALNEISLEEKEKTFPSLSASKGAKISS